MLVQDPAGSTILSPPVQIGTEAAPSASEAEAVASTSIGCGGELGGLVRERGTDSVRPGWQEMSGLPPDVAFVVVDHGGNVRWQRPIEGFALLPNDDVDFLPYKMFDRLGHEIPKPADPAPASPSPGFDTSPGRIRLAEGPVLEALFNTTLNSCLSEAGADPTNGDYSGPLDPQCLWESCLTDAHTAWLAKALELSTN